MSTKSSQSAIPPILAPAPRELPRAPASLTWLCIGSIVLGALGLLVFALEAIGLLATFLGPNLSPPSTQIAPLVKLDQQRQEEIGVIRKNFLLPNIASAGALLAKSLALLAGAIAAAMSWDWGRKTLIWTYRLGAIYLLLWIALYALQMAFETPTVAKYHQLARDLAFPNAAGRAPSAWADATYFTFVLGWMALVIVIALAQAGCFYFGWRYLESDEMEDFFREHDTSPDRQPDIVFEEATAPR